EGGIDWDRLRGAPSRILELIARCLQKDRVDRTHDIADVRIELKDILSANLVGREQRSAVGGLAPAWFVYVGLIFALGLIGLGVLRSVMSIPRPPARVVRLSLDLPANAALAADRTLGLFTVSPDGTRIVYVGTPSAGEPQLFVRPIDQPDSVAIPNTSGAAAPF